MRERDMDKNEEEIVLLDIDLIDNNPEHPFKVVDEDLIELMESINKFGVTEPIIVVKCENGRYQAVTGHRRKRVCELSEIKKVPAIVRKLTRDEAVIQMVDSNIHREKILPSEKAFAYKLKYEAIKHQGKRNDLTLCPMGTKLKSAEVIANNESERQVYRYIRLTELIPELLQMVDENVIGFRPAVELSYLSKDEQDDLLDSIQSLLATPSLSQAQEMKRLSQAGKLTLEKIDEILCVEKPNQIPKYNITFQKFSHYIPRNVVTPKEVEDYVLKCVIICKERGIQVDKLDIDLSKMMNNKTKNRDRDSR